MDWSCHIDFVIPRWMTLPDNDADPITWAEDTADQICASDQQRDAQERLVADLARFAAAPERQEHLGGAVLVPEAMVGVYASIYICALEGSVERPATLEAVRAMLESSAQPGIRPPDVSEVELPAGPAVRLRGLEGVASEDGLGQLVERVTHIVLPQDLAGGSEHGEAVEVTMSWQALHEGDELAELADEIAATLRITPRISPRNL